MVSPTRTDSLYEQIQPLTTVMKNRFVEWFVGSALNHGTSGKVWYKGYTIAVPTMAMLDEVGGGFKITTGTNTWSDGRIYFAHDNGDQAGYEDSVEQFTHDSSTVISIFKEIHVTTGSYSLSGFTGMATGNAGTTATQNANSGTFQSLSNVHCRTGDGTTTSQLETDLAKDTNWHMHRLDLYPANCKLTIDGTLKATKTTNLPQSGMTPVFYQAYGSSSGGTGKQGAIRYMEAYNR